MNLLSTIQSDSTQQMFLKKWSNHLNLVCFKGEFQCFQNEITETYFDLIILDSRLIWFEEAQDYLRLEKVSFILYSGDLNQLNEEVTRYLKSLNITVDEIQCEKNSAHTNLIEPTKSVMNSDGSEASRETVGNTIYVDRVVEKVVEVYKDVYGATDERKIGVINLSPQAGSTFVTLNLAAMLSEYRIVPAIIEPYYAPVLYRTFDMKHTIPNFTSFHHEVSEHGRVLSDLSNNTSNGICFICPNLELYHPPKWGEKEEIKLIMGTKSIIKLVDLGSALCSETYAEIMNLMDSLIVVYDSISEDVDKNILRMVNQFATKRNVHYVANKWHSQLDFNALKYKLSANDVILLPKYSGVLVEEMLKSYKIPYYDPDIKGSIQNAFSSIVGSLLTEELINLDLKMQATFKQKNVEQLPRVNKNKNHKLGVVEIGMMGVSSGVGTTHQTISFASALASQYRVAVVEQGQKRAFREIQKIMDLDVDKKTFEYNGVTYFRDLAYSEFKIHSRESYDVIIVDYGSYEEIESYDDYLAMDYRFVVAQGVDWKIHEIQMFKKMTKQYDVQSNWTYLIPFLEEHELADIRELVDNKIQQIPFSKNPFEPEERYTQLIYKLIFGFDIEHKESKKSVFKIFGRRG